MVKINLFTVLGLLGLLAQELTLIAQDNRVTIKEALAMVEKICVQLGIEFDSTGIEIPTGVEPSGPETTTTTTTTKTG